MFKISKMVMNDLLAGSVRRAQRANARTAARRQLVYNSDDDDEEEEEAELDLNLYCEVVESSGRYNICVRSGSDFILTRHICCLNHI